MVTIRDLGRVVLGVILWTLCGTQASHADFVINVAGTVDSVDLLGNSANQTFSSGAFAGPSTVFGSIEISAELTEVITSSFANEADFAVTSPQGGTAVFDPDERLSFIGTIDVARTVDAIVWLNAGQSLGFEAFESKDGVGNDGNGPDSTWSELQLTLASAPTFSPLPSILAGAHTFTTTGSSLDTRLAVYRADGELIDEDDDGGIGTASLITATLAEGDYYAVIGNFDASFGSGIGFAGTRDDNTSGAAFTLNIDGSQAATGTLVSDELAMFSFSVTPVPEASSLLLLGAVLTMANGVAWIRRIRVPRSH